MKKQECRKLLTDMRERLTALLEQQEDIEQEIAQLKQAIVSIAPLAKEPDIWADVLTAIMPDGITESIRDILRAIYPSKLSPVEIKEKLKNRGQDLSQHKNVMASIHSTLKRMLENEEIATDDEGLTYRWRRRGLPPPPNVHLGWGQPDELPPSPGYTPSRAVKAEGREGVTLEPPPPMRRKRND